MVGFAGNLREFPLPFLCGDCAGGRICKLVPLCELIEQTEGLRFGLPNPTASCGYVVCISATIVPWLDLQGIYANYHYLFYAAMVQEDQFASWYRFVR